MRCCSSASVSARLGARRSVERQDQGHVTMRSCIRGVSLKEGICLLLRLTGVPLLIREVVQRRRVTIVMSHRLDPEVADRHFSALRRHYTPISLQAYLAARRGPPLPRLPPQPHIFTIPPAHRS